MKFCSITIRIKPFLFLLILLFPFVLAQAQPVLQSSTFSPYSRFGIGTMEPNGYAAISAMGGSYTAYQNDTLIPLFINSGNPASYSTNRLTTMEFGMHGANTNFISDSGNVKRHTASFNYLSLAFPIRKNMGAAFGLQPFSSIGYNSTTYTNVDSVGQVKNSYQGTGGVNQVFLGFAIRPFDKCWQKFYSKKFKALRDSGYHRTIKRNRFFRRALSTLSLGTNVSFLYGTMDYYSYIYYPYSYGNVFNTEQYTETVVHDIYYQGGAQMAFDIDSIGHYNLKNNLKIILGYSISLPKSLNAISQTTAYNFSSQSNNVILPFDTFAYKASTKGSIYIPLMQSVGLGFKSGDKVTVLFDGGYQQWSKFLGFGGDNQHMRDLYKGSVGIQFLPSRAATGDWAYLKKINYRIGARYNTGNIVLNGKSLGDYAFSAGLGLPAGGGRFRLFAMANLSGEYGVMGTAQNNLVQAKYFKFTIGLTFNDRWFIKSKYD